MAPPSMSPCENIRDEGRFDCEGKAIVKRAIRQTKVTPKSVSAQRGVGGSGPGASGGPDASGDRAEAARLALGSTKIKISTVVDQADSPRSSPAPQRHEEDQHERRQGHDRRRGDHWRTVVCASLPSERRRNPLRRAAAASNSILPPLTAVPGPFLICPPGVRVSGVSAKLLGIPDTTMWGRNLQVCRSRVHRTWWRCSVLRDLQRQDRRPRAGCLRKVTVCSPWSYGCPSNRRSTPGGMKFRRRWFAVCSRPR